MVQDDEIKATVSPFAVREGEIKTFDGKDGYVSMNQIIHKINIFSPWQRYHKIFMSAVAQNRAGNADIRIMFKAFFDFFVKFLSKLFT